MEIRIADVMRQCNEELLRTLEEKVENGAPLSDIVKMTHEKMLDSGCRILSAFFGDVDTGMREGRHKGMQVNQKRTKTVETTMGSLLIPHTVYLVPGRTGDEKKYVSPLLGALGLTPHQRLSGELQEAVVDAAIRIPDATAIELVARNVMTKPTVGRCIDRMPVPEYPTPLWVHGAEDIHVIVDEDHVPLQKDKDGKKCLLLPVAAITPGKWVDGAGRTRLADPVFFCEGTYAELASVLEGYVARYCLPGVRVHVHSDGAPALMRLFDEFPNVEHVYDAFHVLRKVATFLRRVSDTKGACKKNGEALRKAVQAGRREEAEELVDKLVDPVKDKASKKKAEGFKKTLFKNWDTIVASYQDDRFGCCSESLVEHVLSCALSFHPTAHSRARATRRGQLLVARKNGQETSLRSGEVPVGGAVPLGQFVEHAIQEVQDTPTNFDIFERFEPAYDGASGTRIRIRQIAAGGQCRASVAA